MFKVLVCPRCERLSGVKYNQQSIHGCIGVTALHCRYCKEFDKCYIRQINVDPEDIKYEFCENCTEVYIER